MSATKGTTFGRAALLAGVTALTLTSFAPASAFARAPEKRTTVAQSDTTDISSRRRGKRVYRNNGGAAAAAAFAGIVGTGLAIAAANSRPHYYNNGYYGRPGYYNNGYYGGGPAYYGNGYYGGGPYYRGW